MGTNCAPLVADLFLFCYERDFLMSLSDDKQAKVIDAFNTTSNINNVYFDNMISQIIIPFRAPTELSQYLLYQSRIFRLAFVNF